MRHILRLLLVLALGGLTAPASALPPTAPSSAQRESESALRYASYAGQRLLSLLDQTRLRGDQRRTRCVDRRLSQVNSFRRTLEDRHLRLRQAEAVGNVVVARHERLVIRNLLAQLRDAEREGRSCVFPPETGDGRTIVTVIIDPDVPDLDLPDL